MNIHTTDVRFTTLKSMLMSVDDGTHTASLFALGKAIADGLELSENESFGKKHSVKVVNRLYEINDYIVIPVENVLDKVRKFYEIRQNMAYPKPFQTQEGLNNGLLGVFGISYRITDNELATINENMETFVKALRYSYDFLRAMDSSDLEEAVA